MVQEKNDDIATEIKGEINSHLNKNGGGIIIYVSQGITSNMSTKHKFPDDTEALFIEINKLISVSGCFVDYITHLNLIHTFLINQIKLSMFMPLTRKSC